MSRPAVCFALLLCFSTPAAGGSSDPKRLESSKPSRSAGPVGEQARLSVAGGSLSASLRLVSVSGALSRAEASQALDRVGPSAEACVKSETLKLRVDVRPDGTISSATLLNSVVKDSQAAACARKVFLSGLSFPKKQRSSRLRVILQAPGFKLGAVYGRLQADLASALGGFKGSGARCAGLGCAVQGGPETIGLGRLGGRAHGGGGKATAPRPVAVTVGSGALDPALIRRVVRLHQPQVRQCYQERLHGAPKLEGKIVLRFVISPSGKVESAQILSDTTGDSPLGSCLIQQALGWRFPPPTGGGRVIVSYPFIFRPEP